MGEEKAVMENHQNQGKFAIAQKVSMEYLQINGLEMRKSHIEGKNYF